jgi:hypothetical protein
MRITIIFYFLLISQFAKSQNTPRYLDVPISFIKKTFIDNKDSVNIREYPTMHSKMIDKLPTNFEFTFLNNTETFENIAGGSGNWIKISYKKDGKELIGYVYDFYTQFETAWITAKFSNYYCDDYCIIEFSVDGITIPILNEYCNENVANKYIFSNTNFGPNKDLLNKEFKIRLITKKIADKMTKEISNGTILYRRNFIICDIKL